MSQPQRGSNTASDSVPAASSRTHVAASLGLDSGHDGQASIYAQRILERGADPRAVMAQVRADRLGSSERGALNRALIEQPRAVRFGRGTAAHLQALAEHPAPVVAAPRRGWNPLRGLMQPQLRWSRRLATAGLAAIVIGSSLSGLASAQDAADAPVFAAPSRYIVQPGDTPASIAAAFDVPVAALFSASTLEHPDWLTTDEVVVIPGVGDDDEFARWNGAAEWAPYVAGSHVVAEGETLADIAAAWSADPWVLAGFNGLSDIDTLTPGQVLRIPLTDTVTPEDSAWSAPEDAGWSEPATTGDWAATDETAWQQPVGGGDETAWEQPAGYAAEASPEQSWEQPADLAWEQPAEQLATGPVYAAEVPAYLQAYPNSSQYAAAFIATSAFGPGVPESAFVESVPQSENPHWGYRGDISGTWGGTDNYGAYAEALAPTLQDWGFATDLFYGSTPEELTARLDAGMPVIAWLGYFGETGWQQYDMGEYELVPGMHVVTVYGYDEGGVYLANPGRGEYDYYDWDTFMQRWHALDGMALAVAPQ
ncbi:MAG: LysM peptidoglycan-binding domain-containing protein [Thermomicrobiales bacterium]